MSLTGPKERQGESSDRLLVSIIIIFHNAEQFIREAIESVFAQTYSNWELLLVDDGSIDGSTAIAYESLERHPGKVRYLEHEGHQNCGMSASRNLGICHAKGRYISFLDADDIWLPNILKEQVTILEAHPEAAMVYGPLHWWYSWTGVPADIPRDFVEQLGVQSDKLIEPPTLLPLFLQNKAAVPSGLLVRREVIERVGGFEEAFRGEYEDQVFCAKICLNEPVFVSSQCWYWYRQHPASCVSVGHKTGQTYSARWFFLNWLAEYLSAQEVRHPEVWQGLRRELWACCHPTLDRLVRRAQGLGWHLKQQLTWAQG